jgi:8-oxo-dGTP pyrophosphatase MutT (NUDIX family)
MSRYALAEDPESVPIRDAATVVLVRDGADGIETFLQKRVPQMAFAPGMTVFPGGGVDPHDARADIAWTGPEPTWWAEQFVADAATAQALVAAAVRELFEECGVLLAGRADGSLADPAPLQAQRQALVDKEISLADFLAAEGLSLRADLLRPLAHWTTPLGEKRRYDTRFFVAALPKGQSADGLTSEAAETLWQTGAAAIADFEAGKHVLLPPTWTQLREIARFDTVDELLAASRTIENITPTLRVTDAGVSVEFDGNEHYISGN